MRDLLHLPVLAVSLVGLLIAVSPGRAQEVDSPAVNQVAELLSDNFFSGEEPVPSLGGGLGGGLLGQDVVSVQGKFTAATEDKPAIVFVTATMQPGWHIYSTDQKPPLIATKIKLEDSKTFRRTAEFRAIQAPQRILDPLFDNMPVESHHEEVTWYAPIELTPGVDPQKLDIKGSVYAQACEKSCIAPRDYPFTATLADPSAVPDVDLGADRAESAAAVDYGTLGITLGLAFLGGVILNLMPCVLPVISLKIMAFLEQAGESRARVFTLNLWYALGLLSVFMVLAGLAAGAGLAWGEQFTLPWFKVAMIGLVFAMALSFLGVWEIPIPGFVGSGRAGQLQAKEGASGAFSKGVFTTILATPCSGPFLGPVFGYLLGQPPFMVYWVFGAVGLGMASPYLVIGAFPELIRLLPKPGAWMDTFKQLMGFLLLGTVVYLFSAVTEQYFIPTLTLLVGLWFACWLIGRTPLTVGPRWRLAAWAGGILPATLIGLFAFTVLLWEPIIPWQPFSPQALAKARAEGKTVMVDFTADWCPNCKTNSKVAIERKEVLELVEQNRVVPLLADWTDRSDTIKKALNEIGSNSIPVLVIWPPDGEPVILKDLVTKGQVLDALKQAGPSRPSP